MKTKSRKETLVWLNFLKENGLRIQPMIDLAQKLFSNSHDIPKDFNKIISENFWDLV